MVMTISVGQSTQPIIRNTLVMNTWYELWMSQISHGIFPFKKTRTKLLSDFN